MSGERDAPTYTVKLIPEGKAATRLDLTDQVLSFAFEDNEKKVDKLTLTVDNFDLRNFDSPLWAKGNQLEVSWGYVGHTCPARRMVIKSVKGFQTLQIVAHSKAVLMDREVHNRVFERMTRAQIVRQIAQENGYTATEVDVEDSTLVFPHVHQARLTDAQFIKKLAIKQGFEFYVDALGLHWHFRRLGQRPVRTLVWYSDPGQGDVVSIDIENDVTARAGQVTAKGRDPMQKKNVEGKADNADKRHTLAPVVEVVDPRTGRTHLQTGASTADTRPTSSTSNDDAKNHAKAKFHSDQLGTVKMKMTIVGDPRVEAKRVVEVLGIGKRMSGLYYVQVARHSISGSGYTTELDMRRDGHGGYNGAKNVKTGGNTNTQKPGDPNATTSLEVVDGRTGKTHVEFKRTPPTQSKS